MEPNTATRPHTHTVRMKVFPREVRKCIWLNAWG